MLLIIIAAGFFCVSFLSSPIMAARSGITSFQLSNGMRVILAPVNDIEATCVLLYHIKGVRNDPKSVRGASFLYTDLTMVLPTKHLDLLDRMMMIEQLGGVEAHIVNYDDSVFYHIVPDTDTHNALLMQSDRISSLFLDSDIIKIQQEIIYSRYKRLKDHNIHFRATQWIKSKVFEGTDYSIPVYGRLEEIKTFDIAAIKRTYNGYRDLSGIIMVIAGKFEIKKLKSQINEYFAGIAPLRPPPAKPKTKIIEPSPLRPRSKAVHQNWLIKDLNESFAMYGLLAPAKFNYDYLYFDFIRYYLLDERISKLDEVFNKINKLDIHISYEFTNYHDANALIIKLSCKNRSNLEKAKYYLVKKLESLNNGKGSVSSSDLKLVKTLMELDFLKQMTSLEKRSLFLAEQYYVFGDLEAEDKRLSRIRKIKALDIYRISRKYLKKNNRVNVNVYPKNAE